MPRKPKGIPPGPRPRYGSHLHVTVTSDMLDRIERERANDSVLAPRAATLSDAARTLLEEALRARESVT